MSKSDFMLKSQIKTMQAWRDAAEVARDTSLDRDRGEVTAQTALIVLLVTAAIAAGGIIAGLIVQNAGNVPSP